MTSISLPLNVGPKGLSREEKLKKSIDSSISLILSTAQFSTPADPQFGFVFNNLRFEMFNENEGVVYDSGDTDFMNNIQNIYDKKISGSSKSINTFAAELKSAIEKYETRLENIAVAMTYIREERQIYITVKGTISDTKEDYVYNQTIRVWN
jgi:predicted component of type VI protein secretion system